MSWLIVGSCGIELVWRRSILVWKFFMIFKNLLDFRYLFRMIEILFVFFVICVSFFGVG